MQTVTERSDEIIGDPDRTIELRLNSVSQLLNTLDPSPFRDTDLSPEAERYIVKLAREVPRPQSVRIDIYVPSVDTKLDVAGVLRSHFALREREQASEMRELFRVGRRAMVIGLALLAICYLIAFRIAAVSEDGRLSTILQDTFIIFGWVAIWRPADTYLYEWLALARRRGVFARLAKADVSIIDDAPAERSNDLAPTPT